jgi:hypothetical protein
MARDNSPPFFLRRGSHARLVPFLGPVMPPERMGAPAYSLVGQLSAWREAPGRLFWPPSTVQPCAIVAAFRGDRASCGRLHAFELAPSAAGKARAVT